MSMIIAIDLGTTNSTLAFTPQEIPDIQQFGITQRISPTAEAKRMALPSFYLMAPEEELPIVGSYAKERGQELPDHVVASAKSWLCYDQIDRSQPLLPLGDSLSKKSPIAVCSSFLKHLKECWEKEFPEFPCTKQELIITVPASFDPGARALVQEAAELAGFNNLRLMEEPLAAFYAWLHQNQESWRQLLKVNQTVLVVDVGGGTTDFSLISVEDSAGNLQLERKAVGNHLLLGGDNMDLALAHRMSQKFNQKLDEWQFQSLIHSCRSAKEELLSLTPKNKVELTVQSTGSRLIGGTLMAELSREEAQELLVEGFFPRIPLNEPVHQERRSGIQKLTLPYARDPRITAHLAQFLVSSGAPLPSAVLFNGGVMKSAAFQKRIIELLTEWKGESVSLLQGADLDFAVSRGAVYYGWAKAHYGIRVKAASCKSYFIGVESAMPAVPGFTPPLKKICLVPFGMEEGSELTLESEKFTLVLEENAFFRFFSQNSPNNQELTELHPIETKLHAQGGLEREVLVELKAKITELGVLELWCVAQDGRSWKLEFDTRN